MYLLICKIGFYFSLCMIFYIYVGYPVCVWVLSHLIQKRVDKSTYEPSVSILIAAYNEEKNIRQTITNKLQLDYPEDRLEIIVVSDESTDQTDEIVKSFNNKKVKFFRQKPRAGKTSALNMAVPQANGEILIFSDANSMYATDALKHIVANFHDQEVGYVTGKMIYTTPDGESIGDGCSAYMKYENWLRKVETNLGSIVGVDGGIDAMRKELYSHLNADQLPDFVQPLKVVEKGRRVVFEPAALLNEAALQDSNDEYRMRVRVTLRALWALKDMRHLIRGSAGVLFAWQLLSHKVLRYFGFLFLIVALFTNTILASESIYFFIIMVGQVACYLGAAINPLLIHHHKDYLLSRLLYYFVIINVASVEAVIKFILGKKQVVWVPRKG